MLVVRCTAKLLARLEARPASALEPSTTRLGDWYATIMHVRPAHLVLLVNEVTRLPVVIPARPLSTLAKRIPDAIADVLRELRVDLEVVDRELKAMAEIVYDRTASRSVLGTMNEHVFHLGLWRDEHPSRTEHALSMDLGRVLVTIPAQGIEHPGEFTVKMLASSPLGPPPRQ